MGIANRTEYMVFRADPTGMVKGASTSLCAFLGKDREEFLGKPFPSFVDEGSRERAGRSLSELTSPPHIRYVPLKTRHKGGWKWVGWSLKSVLFEEERKSFILGVGLELEEGAETEETLTRLNLQYDRLARGIQKISGSGNIQDILRTLIQTGIDLTEGDSGTVGLLLNREVTYHEYIKEGKIFSIHYTFREGEGIPGKLKETGKPFIIEEPHRDPIMTGEMMANLDIRNIAAIPLLSRKGEFLGCFEIYNSPRKGSFDEDDLHMLSTLADTGGVAIEKIQTMERQALLKNELFRLSRGVEETMGLFPGDKSGEEKILRKPSKEEESSLMKKVEEVDSLVGGIAHSVNNNLATISGTCELLKMTQEKEGEILPRLDAIMSAVSKTAILVDQLLAYNRKQIARPKILNINSLITDYKRDLGKTAGGYILIQTDLGDGIGNMKMDPNQIRQILLNLVSNSREAMPHGGSIFIKTENSLVDSYMAAKYPGLKTGRYVTLTLSDKGSGIEEKIIDKIFTPFFTTKGHRNATGMGLTTVFGMVKQNSGYIHVESTQGKGACFTIYFPAI